MLTYSSVSVSLQGFRQQLHELLSITENAISRDHGKYCAFHGHLI